MKKRIIGVFLISILVERPIIQLCNSLQASERGILDEALEIVFPTNKTTNLGLWMLKFPKLI